MTILLWLHPLHTFASINCIRSLITFCYTIFFLLVVISDGSRIVLILGHKFNNPKNRHVLILNSDTHRSRMFEFMSTSQFRNLVRMLLVAQKDQQ